MLSERSHAKYTAANTTATAASTGDNTLVTGGIIDLQSMYSPRNATFIFGFTTTLTSAKSLFLKSVLVEHGDDSGLSDAATYKTFENSTGTAVATSAAGGTVTGTKAYSCYIAGAKRYIRLKYTPDLDATSADTAAISVVTLFTDLYRNA